MRKSDPLEKLSSSRTFARNFSVISCAIIIITAIVFFVYVQVVIDEKINSLLNNAASDPQSIAYVHKQLVDLLATRTTERYVILGITLALITFIVVFLSKSNAVLKSIIDEKTGDLNAANKELLEKNQQLEIHGRLQTEFINIAAHELRTPIQPIIATAEILGIYPQTHGEQDKIFVSKADLQLIGRNAARLERLSSDILDVTRIESGSFRLSKQKTDLTRLLMESIEDSRRCKEAEKVKIEFKSPEQPIFAYVDKQRLIQVFSNLLNNAIRFTSPEGVISVSIAVQHDEIKVTVTDSGPGIDHAMLPRLFTKFASSTKAGSGTGLGLYLCKAIVEAHGGTITGHNNTDCNGATFSFTIPTRSALNEPSVSEQRAFDMENSVILQLAKEAFSKP